MVLPGFIPRFRELFGSGFQYIPYFVALVYGAVRLLPPEHPYLNAANIGRYGLRHVMAEAANRLTLSWRHVDQILLFILVMVGMVMMVMQLFLLGLTVFVPPAAAAVAFPSNFAQFFLTPDPAQDLAHIMMDMVFGVPGVFDSCISTAVACEDAKGNPIVANVALASGWGMEPANFPMAMHLGLHQMFNLYSTGLLVVATMMGIYFIVTVVAETMQSGTAFGKRYNHVWAPIRMVVAFGLLIPVGYGLNSAQYIVLYAAKFGSGFATNGWIYFNDVLEDAHGAAFKNLASGMSADATGLVAPPKVPEIGGLLQFMHVARTCYHAEKILHPDAADEIKPYMVKDPLAANPFKEIESPTAVNATNNYAAMIAFAAGENQVRIRFGRFDDDEPDEYSLWSGKVAPICGELILPLADPRAVADQEKGVMMMQRLYLEFIRWAWFDFANGGTDGVSMQPLSFVKQYTSIANFDPNNDVMPDSSFITAWVSVFSIYISQALMGDPNAGGAVPAPVDTWTGGDVPAIKEMENSGEWTRDPILEDKGWAGAAIWYNKIAEMNGEITTAALNIPYPNRYPAVMERVYEVKRKGKGNVVDFATRFQPEAAGAAVAGDLRNANDGELALAYWEAFQFWKDSGAMSTPYTSSSGNQIRDILNVLLGTSGVFSMREHPDAHPLAQLSTAGRGLIEASLRNLAGAAVGGGSGVLAETVSKAVGVGIKQVSGFLVTFGMLSLTAGFILFYIVPFLPFIYFMFGVGGWVKGIFEAMVGAPLWALAHIRIDGNGLSGQAALSGYYLIFEIFLRPILMVFGLLASISTFSALVSVLNMIFDLVVSNVGGFDTTTELTGAAPSKLADMRDAIDEFFFTIIYVVIVYLMGMSSFKLVDLIPNQILRWMGQSITTFNDQRENAAETLTGKATVGMQQGTQAIGGGLKKLLGIGGG
ncbi:MAG: DotA/TraY family protein [Alphaproteobacteria bacterium]|nr:DotA/TraY family protein [Alphaproteobacteria bacterium]